MATMASIWNQAQSASLTAASSKSAENVAGTSGSSPSTNSASTTTISSNDFLSLLVTEMKNQDPTSAADPNQYINQLVQVNSLEQLVQMNQSLSKVLSLPSGASPTPPKGASETSPIGAANATSGAAPNASLVSATAPKAASANHSSAGGSSNLLSGLSAFAGQGGNSPFAGLVNRATAITEGNLGIPASSPAAARIAMSLGGHKN